MTRKDYEIIAGAIKRNTQDHEGLDNEGYDDFTYLDFHRFVDDLAEELAKDNPRFNKENFIQACTV